MRSYYFKVSRVIQKKFQNFVFPKSNNHTWCSLLNTKKYSFWRKFGLLCFLETPVFRFPHLAYYQWCILRLDHSQGLNKRTILNCKGYKRETFLKREVLIFNWMWESATFIKGRRLLKKIWYSRSRRIQSDSNDFKSCFYFMEIACY